MGPRIGVYVCHCGSNIAGIVDTEVVARFAQGLDGVVVARDYKFMCSGQDQDLIKGDVKDLGLNRLVVAACSPTMHEATFRRVLKESGVNPYLLEMANIREHCSWVTENKEKATQKAKALVSAAVRRVYFHQPLESREVTINPNTLIIGGGIAGIQAALVIADSEHKVYLVEKSPSIGGHMAQLDKAFPTLDCSACILAPKMSRAGAHPYIELLTYSQLEEVSGYIGNFKVRVKKRARYVDEIKCNGCGLCWIKCPWKVDSEFDAGIGKRKAIYTPFPQAVPNIPVIDRKSCVYFLKGTCRICEKVCEAKAIDFEQQDELVELEVGSIILATGFGLFDPTQIYQYGYGRLDNVVTSLEFERMVCSSGPTGGNIVLRDGTTPKRLGVIHCVGSRNKKYHEYCSRVCCMSSMKFAHQIKEHLPKTEVYEFYIDIRSFGKGYEEFYNRVLDEGTTFIRGLPAEITDIAETPEEKGKLIVQFEDTLAGLKRRLPLDMVILNCALEPQPDAEAVSRLLNISRSTDGFFLEKHPKIDPVATMTDGIFVVGCCQGPKDIPDTVAQAGAAAAEVLAMISRGRIEIEAAVAVVDERICTGCQVCKLVCPYSAVSFNEEKKVCWINESLCKGCGLCVAACPSDTVSLSHFTNEQIVAQMEGMLI